MCPSRSAMSVSPSLWKDLYCSLLLTWDPCVGHAFGSSDEIPKPVVLCVPVVERIYFPRYFLNSGILKWLLILLDKHVHAHLCVLSERKKSKVCSNSSQLVTTIIYLIFLSQSPYSYTKSHESNQSKGYTFTFNYYLIVITMKHD